MHPNIWAKEPHVQFVFSDCVSLSVASKCVTPLGPIRKHPTLQKGNVEGSLKFKAHVTLVESGGDLRWQFTPLDCIFQSVS